MRLPSLLLNKKTRAIILGVGIYMLLVLGVVAFLTANGAQTRIQRESLTPSVTVSLKAEREEEKVPPSWQAEKAKEEAPALPAKQELPKEDVTMPEPVAAEAEKQVEKTDAPAAQEKPEAKEEVAPAPPVSADTQPRWQKYARPFAPEGSRPRVVLIISDMGMTASTTQIAIQDLPASVTLAFSVLAPNLEADMLKARAAGHEMLLAVPMEPENYPQNDAGPNSLLTALPDDENVARLQRALARTDGFVGVIPAMGGKFIASEKKLAPVMDVLKKEGLLIVDNGANVNSAVAPLARLSKMPFTRADIVIDAAARRTLNEQFAALETVAQERGQVVAIIKPYPVLFDMLAQWIRQIEQKNFILTPVSAVSVPGATLPVTAPASAEAEAAPTAAAPVENQSLPQTVVVE